ncbi:hypothetical protein PFICI_02288 [Pestalotiopsis fici W106-1]|uniref:CFEM domain-containing protein n=1 Tax=Pestalotiopsis fici (strain W106-1 / CGMCC3.15140) TaxID=1229662 RepID=W3XDV7_PESFW|nr:uncharacterized protein PFICI_02288 [Pestalotiopsis fici W106-1]ETS84263.1 hypothetical protein PFICI_02288 [Pestalotiopsis fici W106-1]
MRSLSLVYLFWACRVAALNGINIEPPSCVNRCMVDSMFITQCQDVGCLCHEEQFQKSLFQCLYSQCDPPDYGPALLYSMKTCIASGADINLGFTSATAKEQLDGREVEYLEGRELPEVPGLQLRQDSAGPNTVTAWATTTITMTITTNGVPMPVTTVTPFPAPFPGASGQAGNIPGQAQGPVTSAPEPVGPEPSATKPWMVTVNETSKLRPLNWSLLLWTAGLLAMSYLCGYWGF